jgi:RNA polymerase sigma-70 factor (ECF subfamily)
MVAPGPSRDEDARLMAAVARGDRGAGERLYEAHAAAVMSLLFHLCHDRPLAEDLVQETFVRAWRAAGRWRPVASVRTWLFAIARHLGWNEGEKRRLRRPVWGSLGSPEGPPEAEARPTAGPSDPAEALALGEEAERARRALLGLSPRLRLVFVLVRLEGTSLETAAEIAGVPVGTVKSRLAAAEEALRRDLGGNR